MPLGLLKIIIVIDCEYKLNIQLIKLINCLSYSKYII